MVLYAACGMEVVVFLFLEAICIERTTKNKLDKFLFELKSEK